MSLWLPALSESASGVPRPQVSVWCLEPLLARGHQPLVELNAKQVQVAPRSVLYAERRSRHKSGLADKDARFGADHRLPVGATDDDADRLVGRKVFLQRPLYLSIQLLEVDWTNALLIKSWCCHLPPRSEPLAL